MRGLGNGGFVIADAKIRDTRRKITARTKVVGTLRLPTPAASTPKARLDRGPNFDYPVCSFAAQRLG